jgi:hypothetical protein
LIKVKTLLLSDMSADRAAGILPTADFRRDAPKLQTEIMAATERLATLDQRSELVPILRTDDPPAAFLRAPIEVQRAVLRLLVDVEFVQGAAHPGPVAFDRNSVRLTWKVPNADELPPVVGADRDDPELSQRYESAAVPARPTFKRTCEVCSEPFMSAVRTARYCSGRCRQRALRARKVERMRTA